MGGVHPVAILTDQCESIKIAINELMLNTIHRLCLWHIISKLPQKFKNIANFHKASAEFKAIVYDSITIDTFESRWIELLSNYGMENNEWLQDLYKNRERWSPPYLNNTFCAGMVSTQRSERKHAFFYGYVNSMSTIKQFLEQYELTMSDKIQKEFRAEYESKSRVIKCISEFGWEKQFQKVYTNAIFKQVQNENKRIIYCHIVPPTEEEKIEAAENVRIEKHKVLERCIVNNRYHKEFTYSVEYRVNGDYLSCNCRKFEFKGILCCHVFTVMSRKAIHVVNERYLLRRWRKDLFRRHASIFFAGGNPHMTEAYKKFQDVERSFQECIDLSVGSREKMEFVKKRLVELKNELSNWNPEMAGQWSNLARSNERQAEDEPIDNTRILNPQVTRPRGNQCSQAL